MELNQLVSIPLIFRMYIIPLMVFECPSFALNDSSSNVDLLVSNFTSSLELSIIFLWCNRRVISLSTIDPHPLPKHFEHAFSRCTILLSLLEDLLNKLVWLLVNRFSLRRDITPASTSAVSLFIKKVSRMFQFTRFNICHDSIRMANQLSFNIQELDVDVAKSSVHERMIIPHRHNRPHER